MPPVSVNEKVTRRLLLCCRRIERDMPAPLLTALRH